MSQRRKFDISRETKKYLIECFPVFRRRRSKLGKVDEKKNRKQEALFNTAFSLFTSKGLNKTSISDIVQQAGVAKGTFYLYFKDKYDLQHKLVAHKASQIFMNAYHDLLKTDIRQFEESLIYLTDHILGQLEENKLLLSFISKNLSWGVFRFSLEKNAEKNDSEFLTVYRQIILSSTKHYRDPEVMLFMIIELIGSTCYNAILYNNPVSLSGLKPMLYRTIREILHDQEIVESEEDGITGAEA